MLVDNNSRVIASILLVVGAISCSKTPPINLPEDDPLKSNEHDFVHIIAHKGFWRADSSKPSTNSIASLKYAQDFKLWGSEFDVQMTADSIPIVYHDDDIEGVSIAKNPLAAFSKFKLPNGEEIPTLEKYLSVAARDKELVLVMELKWQRSKEKDFLLIDKSIELLNKYNLLSPDRVVFISFSTDMCERIAQLLPDFTVQELFSNMSLQNVLEMGLKVIDYYQDIFLDDPSIICNAHNLGMDVNVWTVNDKEDMRSLVNYGVDYITTDNPLSLRSLLIEMSD